MLLWFYQTDKPGDFCYTQTWIKTGVPKLRVNPLLITPARNYKLRPHKLVENAFKLRNSFTFGGLKP